MNNEQAETIIRKWRNNKLVDHRGVERTGWMTIEDFNEHETIIRQAIKIFYGKSKQVFYRGPRISNNVPPWTTPSMTRRCDAKFVTL